MSKKPVRPAPVGGKTVPETRALSSFAENLRRARVERGLSQSELAREIWGTTVDGRGYTVARNRDRISVWEQGRAVPEPQSLQKLSDILGIPVEELAPGLTMEAIDRAPPQIHFHMVPGGAGVVHLQINTLCALETAVAIAGLLSKDEKSKAIAAVPA